MALNRYLLYISYIGKPFTGFQRQIKGNTLFSRPDDPSTVQGQLEMALKRLNPSNTPIIYMSSRTDAGVHAFNTTVHADLYREDGVTYDPKTVTLCLNKFFSKSEVPIRVNKTYLVPQTFNCRHSAISRTYLYRLAIIKANSLNVAPHLEVIPIEELERCLFYCTDTFDVESMKEASKLFLGLHDFRTFMGRGSHNPDKVTRRTVFKCDVNETQSKSFSPFSWAQCSKSAKEDYKFYDIYITANGFLYRQVRRMVASLLAVAQGKVTVADIKSMLQVPSHRSWNEKIKTVPAHGLYLCDVRYSASDLGERVTVERARGTPRGRDQWSGGRNEHRSHERYGPPTRTNYRLIVENLSSRISWQDLKDHMRQAGEVTYADAHKQHRNEGVVEFASYADLKSAIEKLDDSELNGRRIKLVEEKRRSRRSGSSSRSRSRSPRRSRSRSRSRRSSKSKSRSGSPKQPARGGGGAAANSKSRSRSNSRKRSPARSRSNSRKRSEGARARSRSRSNHREPSRSRSRSVSKERSKSRSRSGSPGAGRY